jgi:hypothetical protein
MIDLDTFLGTVFETRRKDEHVLLGKQTTLEGPFHHTSWPAEPRWFRGKVASYFNVSTVRKPAEDEDGSVYWRRRREDCVAAYVLVLDDIGTKATAVPPVEPSYKLESSPGNFQWGYLLDPTEDLDRYAAVVEAAAAAGYGDKGAGGYNRLMRVPGSVNIKPGRNGWQSRITEWNPSRFWTLDDLTKMLGLDKVEVKKTQTKPSLTGGLAAEGAVKDVMLEWLSASGLVVEDKGAWVNIVCPWGDQHTSGGDTAGYSPLGRGGEWQDTRSFKCLHEHCATKTVRDLSSWASSRGGPQVQGYDPLPRLQAQYVMVADGVRVADMWQRPKGGYWVYALPEFNVLNPGRMKVPGRDRAVAISTAFAEDAATRKTATMMYRPGDGEIAEASGQPVVNTWSPPTWPETTETPAVFLEHMAFLLPEPKERELFLDWVAWKIQNPGKRSYAMVMVAPTGTQGLGRSSVGDILSKTTGGVNTVDLGKLAGSDSFNDFLFDCMWLVIEEAKDVSADEFWKAYEKIKERIDTRPTDAWRNTKYGKARYDTMWFNAMIFSNHADALAIPAEDRRFCVLTNPETRQEKAYYERLRAAINNGEPGRLYWWLMRRDVSNFDHVYPPSTEAKRAMQSMTRSPAEEIESLISEDIKGDLVTLQQIMSMVKAAARELGHDRVEHAPSQVAKRIFRGFKRLREAKNGARYVIHAKAEEVRSINRHAQWRLFDEARDRDAIVAEVVKNDPAGLKLPK